MISTAHAQSNQGFTLPAPGSTPNASAPNTQQTTTAPSNMGLTIATNENSNKSMLIGLGIVVVVMIAAFFLRGAWANSLVSKKIAPSAANAAGWWLFIFVTAVLGGGLYAIVNPNIAHIFYIGPIATVALVSLVMMFVMSRKK